MRNCTGAALVLIGAWLVWSGLLHRARVVRARPRPAPVGPAEEPAPETSGLVAFGAILRPLIFFVLGYFAIKVTTAYLLLDRGRYFSPFDLAGLLFLLAAYALWLTLQTNYREALAPDRRRPAGAAPVPVWAPPKGKPPEAARERPPEPAF
jgi:hypothetical protein